MGYIRRKRKPTGSVGAGGYVGAQCNDTLYDTVSVSAAQMAAWNADGVIQFSAIDAAGNINTTADKIFKRYN